MYHNTPCILQQRTPVLRGAGLIHPFGRLAGWLGWCRGLLRSVRIQALWDGSCDVWNQAFVGQDQGAISLGILLVVQCEGFPPTKLPSSSLSWLHKRHDGVAEAPVGIPPPHGAEGLEKGDSVPPLAEGECPQRGVLHQRPRDVPEPVSNASMLMALTPEAHTTSCSLPC